MCSILPGLVVDLPVPGGLDSTPYYQGSSFSYGLPFYLAQYGKSYKRYHIRAAQDCLMRFHDNKDVFLDLGIRRQFNLPKLR